jgi:hypothetical protein
VSRPETVGEGGVSTPCADTPELFTSTDFQDHLMARDSCASCYLYRDLCRDVASSDPKASGTYGGDLYVDGRAIVLDRRRP